jgi:hypothetical protein
MWIALFLLLGVILLSCSISRDTLSRSFSGHDRITIRVGGHNIECALPEELRWAQIESSGRELLPSPKGSSFIRLDSSAAQFYVYCYSAYPTEGKPECFVQLIYVNASGSWWLHSCARDGVPKIDRITEEQAGWWIKLFKGELFEMIPGEIVSKEM